MHRLRTIGAAGRAAMLLTAVAALALPLLSSPAQATAPSSSPLATTGAATDRAPAPTGCGSGAAKKLCKIDGAVGARALAVGNCPRGHHCVYYTDFSSWSHNYFDGDQNFTDDHFNVRNSASNAGSGQLVNDNVWAAANSTSSNRESHYYYDVNPNTSSRLVFCVNPDHQVILPEDDAVPNGSGRRNEVSALIIRPRTPVSCF